MSCRTIMMMQKLKMISKLLAILLILGGMGTSVVTANPYSISGIKVQSTAASSALAKENALQQGRKQAFQQMIEKLVSRKDVDRFTTVEDSTIEYLIDSLQVNNEYMGPTSYKATVSFEFNKDRLEEFLRNKSTPFIVPVHKSILILPVLTDGAKTYLFEKENAWLDLWRSHSFNQALVTFVVPNGDLRDISALDAEDALIGATHKLSTIAQRYKVSAIVVPYITITNEGRRINVRLDFQEFDAKGLSKNNQIRSHNINENKEDMPTRAALEKLLGYAINNIQDFVRAQFGGNQAHNLVYLKVPTKSPDDYYKYVQLLNESTMVSDIQPVELSREYSIIKVKTLYTMEDLLTYFKDRGYNFEASNDIVAPSVNDAPLQR